MATVYPQEAVDNALEIETINKEGDEAGASNLCCPSAMSCCLSCVFPMPWISACKVVNVNEHMVVSYWGKLTSVIKNPGCYCLNFAGLEVRRVTTKAQSLEIARVKVNDASGSPIVVDAVVILRVKDGAKALLNVENYTTLITQLAPAVLKSIVSKYPYDSSEGPSLRKSSKEVNAQLAVGLQDRVDNAGVEIISFEMTDLSYAPEIAASMLAKQQAQAMLSARRIIVEGAVTISTDAITKLEQSGLKISDSFKAKTMTNLLTVICAESRPVNNVDSRSE